MTFFGHGADQPPMVESRIDGHEGIDPKTARVPPHIEASTKDVLGKKNGPQALADALPNTDPIAKKTADSSDAGKKGKDTPLDNLSFAQKVDALPEHELKLADKGDDPNADLNPDTSRSMA